MRNSPSDPVFDFTAYLLWSLSCLGHKGPVALNVANDLIGLADRGQDINAGLAAEAGQLKGIFDTHDAQSGIRAALNRQRPAFEGR